MSRLVGDLAEAANDFLDKGRQVFVEAAYRRLRGDAIDGSQNPRV